MKELTYVSAVKFHSPVESSTTLTVPVSDETVLPLAFVILPLIVPVNVELSVSFSVSVESLPTRISPFRVCFAALSSAILEAPLHPSSQTERIMLSLSSFTSVTFSRLITAFVFVTWKMCPFLLVSVPPYILKDDVPDSASPDID